MAIFTTNDQGGKDELIDLTVRNRPGERRFTKLYAEAGRVECEIDLSPNYAAQFDMTVDEALRVAEALVQAAEEAEVQCQEITRRRAAEEAARLQRLGRRRKAQEVQS